MKFRVYPKKYLLAKVPIKKKLIQKIVKQKMQT